LTTATALLVIYENQKPAPVSGNAVAVNAMGVIASTNMRFSLQLKN